MMAKNHNSKDEKKLEKKLETWQLGAIEGDDDGEET